MRMKRKGLKRGMKKKKEFVESAKDGGEGNVKDEKAKMEENELRRRRDRLI